MEPLSFQLLVVFLYFIKWWFNISGSGSIKVSRQFVFDSIFILFWCYLDDIMWIFCDQWLHWLDSDSIWNNCCAVCCKLPKHLPFSPTNLVTNAGSVHLSCCRIFLFKLQYSLFITSHLKREFVLALLVRMQWLILAYFI